MFCNKCGAQLPEESAFCPKCGAPVAVVPEGPDEIPVSEPEAGEVVGAKSKLPAILMAAVVVFVVIFVAVSINRKIQGLDITAKNVNFCELYNPSLGVGLRLEMKKDVVDRKLGTPDSLGDSYRYTDTYLYGSYAEGKLAHMYISYPNDRWITKNGVTIGTTTDELRQLLGQPNSIEHDDQWWYYIFGSKVTGFEINRDFVMSIYIYDRALVNE